MRKLDRYEFIWKSIQRHGYTYDYREVNYIDSDTYVKIYCDKHKKYFEITPKNHLRGKKCKLCANEIGAEKRKIPKEINIKKAQNIHRNEDGTPKYDYSLINQDGTNFIAKIICPKHGIFEQNFHVHLSGFGCQMCARERTNIAVRKKILNKNDVIQKSIDKFGNKFSYEEFLKTYVNFTTPCLFKCNVHNIVFKTTPQEHLKCVNGACPKCNPTKKKTKEEFVLLAQEIHKNIDGTPKYIYDDSVYISTDDYIYVLCPEHGVFRTTPYKHIKRKQGCPICKQSKLEDELYHYFRENKIYFLTQKNFEWLYYSHRLRLDFYLPQYNIAIECQGIQHFKPIDFFGGQDGYDYIIERDNIKRKLCEENGVKLLYFSNLGIEYPYHVFEDKEKLLEEIINNKNL